ncbi:MAG TPA: zinc ribbon domain-containing protein [Planctomycetes bacterium]|nr:zinc ribbon domain-containing protein [Planctomycetota bacterium]
MPTYDYKCKACGHTFALFQSMTENPKKKCPSCGRMTLVRLIGTGSGIIFKGSGFYETDYKRRNGKATASHKSQSPKEAGGGEASSKKEETKPAGTSSSPKEKKKD